MVPGCAEAGVDATVEKPVTVIQARMRGLFSPVFFLKGVCSHDYNLDRYVHYLHCRVGDRPRPWAGHRQGGPGLHSGDVQSGLCAVQTFAAMNQCSLVFPHPSLSSERNDSMTMILLMLILRIICVPGPGPLAF
jgi:hypothetical protein